MKIVAIVGSLRKESLNLKLAKIVSENFDESEFEIITLEKIPMFNEDLEVPAPKIISDLRKKIDEADLLWLFSPEYNHSYSGVMKNTLDWLSRTDEEGKRVLSRKKIALSGISPGANGTAAAQDELVKLLALLNADILVQPRLSYAKEFLPGKDDKYLLRMIEAVERFLDK